MAGADYGAGFRPGIRVLHVVDSLGAGGMENGIVNVAGSLEGRVDSWVAALSERGIFSKRMPTPSQVVELGKEGGFSIRVASRLAKIIDEVRPDVIHSHNLGPLIYLRVARFLGGFLHRFPPIVHGEHSMIEGNELGLRRMLQRRLLYRECSAVHTVSSGLLAGLRGHGLKAKRMMAIINGVDCERFRVKPDRRCDPDRIVVLGCVGRLVERKRHVMLIKAFERIAGDYPRMKLLLVGDQGPERESVKKCIEDSPVEGRIDWVPFQEQPERYYQKMDLLVVPSESEGLANVVLEAMACGVPVVGSLACGTPEVVNDGETGLLGTIEKVGDLEVLLRRAVSLDAVEIRAMGNRAREEAVRRFSLAGMAEAYYRLYQSMSLKTLVK